MSGRRKEKAGAILSALICIIYNKHTCVYTVVLSWEVKKSRTWSFHSHSQHLLGKADDMVFFSPHAVRMSVVLPRRPSFFPLRRDASESSINRRKIPPPVSPPSPSLCGTVEQWVGRGRGQHAVTPIQGKQGGNKKERHLFHFQPLLCFSQEGEGRGGRRKDLSSFSSSLPPSPTHHKEMLISDWGAKGEEGGIPHVRLCTASVAGGAKVMFPRLLGSSRLS